MNQQEIKFIYPINHLATLLGLLTIEGHAIEGIPFIDRITWSDTTIQDIDVTRFIEKNNLPLYQHLLDAADHHLSTLDMYVP